MDIEIVKMKECPYFGWQSLANHNAGKQNLGLLSSTTEAKYG